MTPSNTPRTDALFAELIAEGCDFTRPANQFVRFAERLERELAEARARLEWSPDHPYDGITCRDETIKQLDRIIDEQRIALREKDAAIQ